MGSGVSTELGVSRPGRESAWNKILGKLVPSRPLCGIQGGWGHLSAGRENSVSCGSIGGGCFLLSLLCYLYNLCKLGIMCPSSWEH